MKLVALQAFSLNIPFRQSFRHASAERSVTQTLWVEARSATQAGYGEGCPREYVTGEGLASAHAFVGRHAGRLCQAIDSVAALRAWIAANQPAIDADPAAWCAVELALLDWLGKEAGRPLEALLDLPPLDGSFRYSAVLGDSSAGAFEALLARYREAGFTEFKIKLSGEPSLDRDKVRLLKAAGLAPDRVRADANNLWNSPADAAGHLGALDFPFWAVEEPLQPGDLAGLHRLAGDLGTRIILDESFQHAAQMEALPGAPDLWILNLRVSKLGGVIRSLAALERARQRGLDVMIGAHVGETSLLTRAALTLAAYAGDSLLGQEGAVGTHLLQRDVIDPPLMFGAGGRLDSGQYAFPQRSGLGLDVQVAPGDKSPA